MSNIRPGERADEPGPESPRQSSSAVRADDGSDASATGSRSWLTPRWRLLGLIVGIGLLAVAVLFVAQQREALTAAWQHIRQPSILPLLVLPIAVLANLVLSGVLFRLLLSRFGRVGWMEMQAVIAAATLINFIPLRPGLPGRLLYHRAANRIPLMQSGRTVIEAALISIGAGGYLALAALSAMRWEVNLWYPVLAPLPVLIGLLAVPGARLWMLAILVRYVEVLIWAVRYACAFALIGSPIDPEAALALACVSIVATMVPLFSNGLGLREWAIGLVAPLLTAHALELGIIAELVNRAVELIIITLTGIAGMMYLAHRSRRHDEGKEKAANKHG